MINDFIKSLRLKNRYTQEHVAEILGMSRQSYSLIEKGEKELTLENINILSNLYSISKENFIKEKEGNIKINIINNNENINDNIDIRINIPQKNIDKFKQVFLYILSKIGAKPNVGQAVLYKILYFIDFDFYEKYEKQLMGITYIRNHYGPTPIEFKEIIRDMIKNKEIEEVKSKYYNYDQTKYLPIKESNLELLSAIELKHIDEELDRLSNKTADELSKFSHKDVPWIVTEEQGIIDYETVFYRTQETSVRIYDDNL